MRANPFTVSGKFRGKRIHLGVGGSVAAYKAAGLLRMWLKAGIHVSTTLTEAARQFVSPLLFRALGAMPVYGDMFAEGETFSHLEPGQLGGAFVAAPATADMLARLAGGFASDLLSCQALAFAGPKVIAPAMNPLMWQNPATQANVEKLEGYGWRLVRPESGEMACGDTGEGRLAEAGQIFLAGLSALAPQDMAGLSVLVTLGPTREFWDGARFWSNPSSGAMGAALATAAWLRGARVFAICGPVDIEFPAGVEIIRATSAKDMFLAAKALWNKMDIGMFCAAVADFYPEPFSQMPAKAKKSDFPDGLAIRFQRNPDILRSLALPKKSWQKVLGFAAETVPDAESLLPLARLKLADKNADLLAANRIGGENSAFGAEKSMLAVVDRHGKEEIWPVLCKADAAWELCSWLLKI